MSCAECEGVELTDGGDDTSGALGASLLVGEGADDEPSSAGISRFDISSPFSAIKAMTLPMGTFFEPSGA